MSKFIIEPYTPKPEIQNLDEVYDFKRCCMDSDEPQCRVFATLNIISFNHFFLIKRSSTRHNLTLLYAKQYSTSSQWEPQEGCRFLLSFLDVGINGAEQMSYNNHKKLAPDSSIKE